jgi:hypothetical protein
VKHGIKVIINDGISAFEDPADGAHGSDVILKSGARVPAGEKNLPMHMHMHTCTRQQCDSQVRRALPGSDVILKSGVRCLRIRKNSRCMRMYICKCIQGSHVILRLRAHAHKYVWIPAQICSF